MPKSRTLLLALAVALSPLAVVGQNQTSKSNDQKHSIHLETDSGRYGVGSDKLDPRQLGVAIYPGATVVKDDANGKGANLSFDWGEDSMHLYVQKYATSDSTDKVLAFYRKQLAKYGAVLECRDGKPLVEVSSQLKCGSGDHDNGIELKAGSENRQHIVAVTPKDGHTEFGVVYLEKTGGGEL